MSDQWQMIFTPVAGLGDIAGANTGFTPYDETDLNAEWPRIPDAPGQGRFTLAVFDVYHPQTVNLPIWSNNEQPKELWGATGDEEPMVNLGPHQVVLVGEEVVFDAELHHSMRNCWTGLTSDDGAVGPEVLVGGFPITPPRWDWGDGSPEEAIDALRATHIYASPGLYTVTVRFALMTATRWVRVFTSLEETDLTVVSVESFAGSIQAGGWTATLVVSGDVSSLTEGTHAGLYLRDSLDIGWRHRYSAQMFALNERFKWNSEPPPDPNYLVDGSGNPVGTAAPPEDEALQTVNNLLGSNGLASPGGTWALCDQWDTQLRLASDAQSVPVNLLKAMMRYFSNGNPSWVGQTGNTTCGLRQGLVGIHDCFFSGTQGLNPFDPKGNCFAAARELRAWYQTCGQTWWTAINGYLTLTCLPDGSFDVFGREDNRELRIVLDYWAELDAAAPARSGTSRALALAADERPLLDTPPPEGVVNPTASVPFSQLGQNLFSGYVTEITVINDGPETGLHRVILTGSQGHLQVLTRKVENFWEDTKGVDYGGTFINGGPPMRIPDLIYHMVSHHTDWQTRFDLQLDFTTPRSGAITFPEGPVFAGLQQWAENDFGQVYAGRWGQLRYTSQPSFLGQAWWDEAYNIAPVWSPDQLLSWTVSERTLNQQVTWVKLGGYGKNACAQYGEHPCGGPPQGSGGQWIFQQGLWYDDAHILGDRAAHLHAFSNRHWDVQLEMPWRHDLELGDLFRLPFVDPSGRFDWRVHPRLFEIVEIAHQINVADGTMVSTIKGQQVTFGLPCFNPRALCPEVAPSDPNFPDFPPFPGPNGPDFPDFPGGGSGGFPPPPSIVTHVDGIVRYTSAGNGLFHEAWTDDVSTDNPEFYSEKARGYKDWGRVTQTTCLVVTVKGLGYQPLVIKVRPGSYSVNSTDQGDHVNYLHQSVAGTEAELRILRILPVTDLSDYLLEHPSVPFGDGTGGPDPLGAIPQADLPTGIDGVEVGGIGEVPHTPEGYPVLGTVPGGTLPYLGVYGDGPSPDGERFWQSPLEAAASELAGVYSVSPFETIPTVPTSIGDQVFGSDAFTPFDVITPGIPGIDPTAPLPSPGLGSGVVFNATPGWREYRLYLSAEPDGRSYLIGFVPTTMGKQLGSTDVITLAPATEPRLNTEQQPFVGFEAGIVRLDYELEWDTPTYFPGRGETFGDEAGDGSGGPDPTFGQTNWPTAEAINARISLAEQSTKRSSKLHGSGAVFLELGGSYGINPGFVAGLLYAASRLGADGSPLAVVFNNFGEVTGTGTCGDAAIGDATGGPSGWAAYCTPQEGLEAIFALVDTYRAFGSVSAILAQLGMSMQATMTAVGATLGIDLSPDVTIITAAGQPGVPAPANGQGAGTYATMLEYSLHQYGGVLTQGPYQGPSHSVIDAYDIAVPEGTPVYALTPGEVTTGFDSIYGNWVDVAGTYGTIRLSHLSSVLVSDGQTVTTSEQLGLSGNTGSSTGPHVHIELRFAAGLSAIMVAVGFNIASFSQ